MSLPIILRPEAETDMAEARDWYERQSAGLGQAFLTAVEAVFAHVGAFPESYAAEYRGVRRAAVQRFPYVVYYRITGESVEVLAVLHGSRHPRAWRSRA
jgi:plasmid stabilization system protein ParE